MNLKRMGKYLMSFESHSKRKKTKKKIWDELLEVKPRKFKSERIEPEVPLDNPDMMIPLYRIGILGSQFT